MASILTGYDNIHEFKLPVELYEVGLISLLGFYKLTVSPGVTEKVHRTRGRLSPAPHPILSIVYGNVSLFMDVVAGHPSVLSSVRTTFNPHMID